jgi:hypothetical protein
MAAVETAAWAAQPAPFPVAILARLVRAADSPAQGRPTHAAPPALAALCAALLASQHIGLSGALLVLLAALNTLADPTALKPMRLLTGFAIGCVAFIADAHFAGGAFLGAGVLIWRLAAEAHWARAHAEGSSQRLEIPVAAAAAAGLTLLAAPARTLAGLPLPEGAALAGAALLAPALIGAVLCLAARLSGPRSAQPIDAPAPFAAACLFGLLAADALVLLCALAACRLASNLQARWSTAHRPPAPTPPLA